VLGIDEDNARVMVSLAVGSSTTTVSQYAIKLVTKTEFDKFSKYLSELSFLYGFTYTLKTVYCISIQLSVKIVYALQFCSTNMLYEMTCILRQMCSQILQFSLTNITAILLLLGNVLMLLEGQWEKILAHKTTAVTVYKELLETVVIH